MAYVLTVSNNLLSLNDAAVVVVKDYMIATEGKRFWTVSRF